MKRSEKHILKFAGLKDGNHIFSYEINNRFFHHFNFNDFNQSSLRIDINLEKKATVLDLKINSKGLVNVDCSVSNEPFDYVLNSKLDLIVKFGEFYDDSNDELIVLPYGSHSLELDQIFYEMIVLSIPIKLVHPGIADGSLKSEIVNRLSEFDINKEKSSNFDPRWNKLKELKK